MSDSSDRGELDNIVRDAGKVDRLVNEAKVATDEAVIVSKRVKNATKLYRDRLQGDKKK